MKNKTIVNPRTTKTESNRSRIEVKCKKGQGFTNRKKYLFKYTTTSNTTAGIDKEESKEK